MNSTPPNPTSQIEPRRDPAAGAISLLIRYDAATHGPPLAFYSALKAELNRLHIQAGGSGVRLGLATAAPTTGGPGRISIPITPLNPADDAAAMTALVHALRSGDTLPGIVDIESRAA